MKYIFTIAIIMVSLALSAQMTRLANTYYNNGEYEKAAELYAKVYKTERNKDIYFQRLTECLLTLKRYDEVEQLIKDEIKESPADIQNYVVLGSVYERQGQTDKANVQFKKALDNLDNNMDKVSNLAKAFIGLAKYEEAIDVYLKGSELTDNETAFAFSLADLYRRVGDESNMITYYIKSAKQFANNKDYLYRTFEQNLSDEAYDQLQSQLYAAIQAEPDEILYPEILQWSFIHLKEYDKALRQARALDRKLDENGARVYEIGTIAFNDQDYGTAIDAFEYILENKNIN